MDTVGTEKNTLPFSQLNLTAFFKHPAFIDSERDTRPVQFLEFICMIIINQGRIMADPDPFQRPFDRIDAKIEKEGETG